MRLVSRGVRLGGRLPVLAAVATLALGAVVLSPGPATAAEPHHVFTPSLLAYTDSTTPDTAVFYPSGGDIPVGSWRDDAGTTHSSRIYVTFDVGGIYAGRLSRATLVGRESRANDCARTRATVAQATAAFTGESSWSHPPATVGKAVTATAEGSDCNSWRTTWDLTAALTKALGRGEHQLTTELRIPKRNEGDVSYGRWLETNEFRFEVELNNTAPLKPTRLFNANTDTPCGPAYFAGSEFSAHANMTDRDRDPYDELTAEMQFWPLADPSAVTPVDPGTSSGADGLNAVGQIPVASLTDGEYAWHARTYDQRAWSPWSDPCHFTVDRTKPAVAPTVASPEYPENPANPTGSTGTEGTFLFTSHGVADVVSFRYGDSQWTLYNQVAADQLGGAATIRWRPRDAGEQTLYVASVDRAGNSSPVRAYTFKVRDLTVNAWSTAQQPDPSGSGMAVTMRFSTQPGNGITTIAYRVDGGSEQLATVGADGVAEQVLTPLKGGEHQLSYVGRSASGEAGYQQETTFFVDDGPTITSDGVYPIEGSGGGVAVPGVFTVSPAVTQGATSVRWFDSVDNNPRVVPLAADGKAKITWTPTTAGWTYFWFTVEYADGSLSSYRSFSVTVN
ncbi:hypothetical protein [Micromonospora ureilytica]|uniref:Fibronectin type-III domain-containing protein n=1 Tax=Micromonospora ureilytica TaxID=709868 RepID=A0ABS0JQ74_9ACTN|nr:hypothetical protein [Micromonospora ureilytica]MBG6069197.1 hypothetical protein [Micromonospora ureilytica]